MALAVISFWGHALAAMLFGALTLWLVRPGQRFAHARPLAAASFVTAGWAIASAMNGPEASLTAIAEALRNIAWLGLMFSIWRAAYAEQRPVAITSVYGVATVVFGLAIMLDTTALLSLESDVFARPMQVTSQLLKTMGAVAGLVLVHNLYNAATPDGRAAIRVPMIALSVMWLYGMNSSAAAYFEGAPVSDLGALAGVVMCAVGGLFWLGISESRRSRINLSRSATFQSLGFVAIAAYLALVWLVSSTAQAFVPGSARAIQVGFIFGSSVAAIALLPSARFRAWLRVKLAKNLFQHRYDYRAEWVRFTDTIGRPADDAAALDMRIIQAVADIVEAPAGLLLVPDEGGALIVQTRWNCDPAAPAAAAGKDLVGYLASGRIVEVDIVRGDGDGEESRIIPEWLLAIPEAWAIVPLIHFDRVAGVLVLMRPPVGRTLDWEDFDLLRVVARQAASYLAEARGHEALADAQQFDEFNRRFAFIAHDIKNLASQLGLVTRNAEKHLANPAFQADMIATLDSSTAKLNDLLARLSQHSKIAAADTQAMRIGPVIEKLAAARRGVHPIVIGGDLDCFVETDPVRLEQALLQILQNAIDASPDGEPVSVRVQMRSGEAIVTIEDKGCGMSSHFVRHMLFKPFASTKEAGFGIGAYEARALIVAMGGRLDVSSREGEGTRFQIALPAARERIAHHQPEKLVA